MKLETKYTSINKSKYISRDFSWLQFNYRVLDLANDPNRNILERLKFLAITGSNLDEFFMIRVGSLYNYLDYNEARVDYSGLREEDFRKELLKRLQEFVKAQHKCYENLIPLFKANYFNIYEVNKLSQQEQKQALVYFKKFVFPLLTPMTIDSYRTFPLIFNKNKFFSVRTKEIRGSNTIEKLSFLMVPQNIDYFYEIERQQELIFVPTHNLIRTYINYFFKNVEILSCNLLRITRNGEFTLEESEDLEIDFMDEIRRKLKTRRTGRVVRLDIKTPHEKDTLYWLHNRWDIDDHNTFKSDNFLNYTGLWQIVNHKRFKHLHKEKKSILPLHVSDNKNTNIYEKIKHGNILLHHPYNNMETLINLLETSAEDPSVLAIKITIYRLAKSSKVIQALGKAVENGKHVSVLFEIKARFDEENNIKASLMLERMGCFVIHGISSFKTHTKVLMIVRKEANSITRYIHLGTGNYNEHTSKLYTDIGFITSEKKYANDVSDFFNVITGHSKTEKYEMLLTAPNNMREELIKLINKEAEQVSNKEKGRIILKMNSLQDNKFIDALYNASQKGVKIDLIIRGICCLRPGRKGLSENIKVRSIIGNYLEHSRLYYFHNKGEPIIYCGSADAMVRSFDRRIESLFLIDDINSKKKIMNILDFNLRDNVNSYFMKENASYEKISPPKDKKPYDLHKAFFEINQNIVENSYKRLLDFEVGSV